MSWFALFPQRLQGLHDSGDWLEAVLGQRSPAWFIRNAPFSPAPQSVQWQSNTANTALKLEKDEKKLVQAFAYVLSHQKKSSKRYTALQELHDKYQSEDLAEMMMAYLLLWESPEKVEEKGIQLLEQHPDSLGLRLHLSLLSLQQGEPEKIEGYLDGQTHWAGFCALHPEMPQGAFQVRTFHTLLCLYESLNQRLWSALYAWLVCRSSGAAEDELKTLSRQVTKQCQAADELALLKQMLKQQ